MKFFSLVCLLLFIFFTVNLVESSLPESTTAPTNSSAFDDDDNHDDDRDHDDVLVEKSATSHIVPSSIIQSALRTTIDRVKPLLTRRSSSNENLTVTTDDEHDYDEDETNVETEEPEAPFQAPQSVNETIDVLKMWSRFTTETVETVLREITPLGVQLSYDVQVSSECAASFLKVFNGLRRQELWAFRVIDSYGRFTPGFLDGTVSDFGEFEECLAVTFPKDDDEKLVVGKYCMMLLHAPLPPRPSKHLKVNDAVINFAGTELEGTILDSISARLNQLYTLKGFRFGLCMPSTCTASEIEAVVNYVITPILKTNVTIGPDWTCDTRLDDYEYSRTQLVAISVFVISITLVSLGSLFDLIIRLATIAEEHVKNKLSTALLSFSMIRNTEKLFHVREDREETLSAIHGLRVISMFWIIIGHTYCFGGFYKVLYTFKRLAVDSLYNPSRWGYQPLINAFLLVETFFFLGGVVLIYVALPMLEKHRGRFNYLVYVIHRWSRLTPALIGVICFIILMPVFGTGPIWKREMTWQSDGCQKNWWLNLLFLNNWIDPVDEMCGGQTWFIAADFQIYLFAPIIFLSYYRSAMFGLIVNVVLLIGGMIASGVSAYRHDSAPTYTIEHIIDLENLHDYSKVGYFPTYHHIAPYCLGTLVGYFILKYRENKPVISIRNQSIAWYLSTIASMFILFCTQGWNDAHNKAEASLAVSVLFSMFQRDLWCALAAWISFACATGYGGVISKILSWRAFVPLSRLSYSIYMVHLIPIFLRTNSLRYTRAWDDFMFLSWASLNIILGVLGAYLLYIFFESPMNGLEKLLLTGSERQTNTKPSAEDVNNNNNIVELDADLKMRTSDETFNQSDSGREDESSSSDIKVDVDSASDSGHSSRKSSSKNSSTGDCSRA